MQLLLKLHALGYLYISSHFEKKLNKGRKTIRFQKIGLILIIQIEKTTICILKAYASFLFNLENLFTQKIHNKNTIP